MKQQQRFSASVGRGLLALFYSVAPIEKVPPCDRTWPPSLEEWCSAAGGSSEVRLRHSKDQPWILAYEPLWATDSLLARPSDVVKRDALNDIRTGSRTLHVAWSDIERLERKKGTLAGVGVVWGLIVGVGGLGVLSLSCIGEEGGNGEFDLGCGLAMGLWLIFGMPVVVTMGAVVGATRAQWVPVYCSPEKP